MKKVKCDFCQGTKEIIGALSKKVHKCFACEGTGKVSVEDDEDTDDIQDIDDM